MADLRYEVSFKGEAGPTMRAAFGDCDLRHGVGFTSLRCAPGAFRAVVVRMEDLGLELLDVRLIAEHSPDRRPPRVERPATERGPG